MQQQLDYGLSLFDEAVTQAFGFGLSTPLTTVSPLETFKKPVISQPNPSGLVIPNILQQSSFNTGTISPGDRSQLAKSGDIDITEALVNRG